MALTTTGTITTTTTTTSTRGLRDSTLNDPVWEAMHLLRNLEQYGGASDAELGELLGWFLQAHYGNAHETTPDPRTSTDPRTSVSVGITQAHRAIGQEVQARLGLKRCPESMFAYWQEYAGTCSAAALTLFAAGVNKKFGEKQSMGVFFF